MSKSSSKTPDTPRPLVEIFAIPLNLLGVKVINLITRIGSFLVYLKNILAETVRPPWRLSLISQQLEFVGNNSLNIIVLTGFFTGAVFGLQVGGIFQIFQAESLMGAATGKALARELSPLMTAFLVGGRGGSAMTAELATMRVNEQIDAMEAMGVDPISYLVVPRFLATVIMMPLLCGLFSFTGMIGAYLIGTMRYGIDQGLFLDKLTTIIYSADIVSGLWKSFVFGVIIASTACLYGLKASGGAKGVGDATTDAVVWIFLMLLGFDVVITYIQIMW